MRVLHYKPTMRAEEGGVVKAVFDLCKLTASPAIDVGLVTYHTDLVRRNLPACQSPEIRLFPVDLPHAATRLLSRRDLRSLREIISEYDLVHLHTIWTPSNIQITRICRSCGIPYVLTVHGMLDDWCMTQSAVRKRVFLRTWARRLLPDAAGIHATSAAEKEQIDRRSGARQSVMLQLPIELEEYKTPPGPQEARERMDPRVRDLPMVLYLSRLHPKKGPDRLIRASAMLHRRGIAHHLVLAGSGDARYVESLRRLSRRLQVEDRTTFAGFVAGREKISLFQAATAFALPTSQENFGFVFFEALAAGTAVVTTKGADTWREIVDSGGGIAVDNSPEAFADALRTLLEDTDRAGAMGASGRSWTLKHFDRAAVVNEYELFYRACLGDDR